MFSGIIRGIAKVVRMQKNAHGARVLLDCSVVQPKLDLHLGDSVAVNGVCLTVIAFNQDGFEAEISNTTLSLTNLDYLKVGSGANVEPALTLSQAVNGHLVTGHVDSVCHLDEMVESGFSRELKFSLDEELSKYVVERGSVTLDGISLTVNSIEKNVFKVTIVPHTWEHTIAQDWQVGDKINLEVDMLMRYLERLQKHNENN